MRWETENPTLVKVIGACVSTVMFVAAALLMHKSAESAVGLMMGASGLLGAVGITVGKKS